MGDDKKQFQKTTVYDNNLNPMKKEDEIYSKLETRINRIIESEGYVSHTIHKRIVSTQGNNYGSLLLEIDIAGKTKDGDKETHIFAKYTLPENGFEHLVKLEDLFAKEVIMYRKLDPVFTQLQEEANISYNDRYKISKSYEGCNEDAILLENLTKSGFNTLYRMDVVPLKFAELSIVELAKFHGLSFALQKKRPDFFENIVKTLKPAFDFNNRWQVFAKKVRDVALTHLGDENKIRIEAFVPTIHEKYPKYLSGDTSSVKCLCYGDFRMSNILTRFVDGEPAEVIPVDYQVLYYGSPVVDLIYFIFSISDKQFRKQYMSYLKDLYFNNLEKFLKYFHIEANQVYPREVFEQDFEDSLDYGMMYGLMFLPFSFTSEEEIIDMGKSTAIEAPLILDDRFKERITDLIEDYIEWGIL